MATTVELERIQVLIGRVGAIAGRWQAGGDISDMERELMLDKLRGLYEEVLFLDREEFAAEIAGAAADPELTVMAAPVAMELQPGPKPLSEEVIAEETVVEPVVEEPVVWESSEPEEALAAEPEPPAAEPKAGDAPETTSVSRNRAAQDVIRALYGDMPAGGARQPLPETERVPEPRPVPGADIFAEPVTSAVASRTGIPGNGNGAKVLGEVIGGQPQAFNEVLGQQHAHEDVASRLRAGSVSDLRHSIGLNDRFLLIRELFDGHAAAYDEAIAVLDAFTDLDDTMIYIQENFKWRPDAEATLLLVDLLERKLEQR